MIVTGAFLAERAFAADEKLHVVGGVWDHVDLPPAGEASAPDTAERPDEPQTQTFALVVLLQAAEETRDHTVIPTRLLDPDGELVAQLSVDVTLRKGTEIGFAVATVEVGFTKPGRYLFVIEPANGHGISLPLHVRPLTLL